MSRRISVEIVGDASSLQRTFGNASRSAKTFDKDLSRSARGVVAATLSFRGLGRAASYASGYLIAGGGLVIGLRDSISAAEDLSKAQRSLAVVIRRNGGNVRQIIPDINKWAKAQAGVGVSAVQAEQGLARATVITGNARAGMRAYTEALLISKATGKDFTAVLLAAAKANEGQTTALARYIGKLPKGITAQELYTRVLGKYQGQAQANTDATDKLRAALSNVEVEIGQALLPTVEKIATKLADWLDKTKNQERIQRDVTRVVRDATDAFSLLKSIIDGVDKITGSFKNTLEIIVGIKLARWAYAAAGEIGLVGASAATSEGQLATLRGSLAALANINPIVIPITLAFAADRTGLNPLRGNKIHGPTDIVGILTGRKGLLYDLFVDKKKPKPIPKITLPKPLPGGFGAADLRPPKLPEPPKGLTAKQRNQFFDNQIARILLRGGLGTIQQQIAALEKADRLIAARLKVTKDVTRRLNLEDELLQNQAQIRTLKAEEAAKAAQKAAAAHQKALQALAREAVARNARQFRALGFTATGEDVVPGVTRLKKELANVSDAIKGTFLDTGHTESLLRQIRRVLSGQLGAVGRDVRQKIQEILSGIDKQLNNYGTRNQTKFAHIATQSILSGLGLTPDQIRKLRARIDVVGAGGSLPSQGSAAFAANGAQTVVNTTITLDGRVVAKSTTKHQRKDQANRSGSRRGPYAGRH